jgi:hypothetical protein
MRPSIQTPSISNHIDSVNAATIGSSPPTTNIADTGTTGHFLKTDAPCINKRKANPSIAVLQPDGSPMYSTHEADLDIPGLPPEARNAHLLPSLEAASLISIGQLCDSGCVATFTATTVSIDLNGVSVLTGTRSPVTRLWSLDFPVTPRFGQANAAYAASLSATPAQLVAFAHAALFSPALSTLVRALEEHYISGFPGLSSKLLRKYPPQSVPMVKGHLDQSRQNQRSTKPQTNTAATATTGDETDDDFFPSATADGLKTHFCYAACMESTGKIFTDQTGRFILPSSTGNNQLLVLYDYDSNFIHAEPMKSKSGPEILAAYKRAHKMLCTAGLRPKLQRLDNECSESLKEFMTAENVDFQLVPPLVHRRNAAERAIRTFKNHFIAGLCSTAKDFPLHLWDRLLPQALLTLNLLRGSRINPKLSAWAQVNGPYDYNRTPIAPPGIRVVVHNKPEARESWAPHGSDGWYVGPAPDSYRCFTTHMIETQADRISDTVVWLPEQVTMPTASSTDIVIAGANDIVHALKNPSPGSPLAPLTDSEVAVLHSLTEILLNRRDGAPPPPEAPVPLAPTPVPQFGPAENTPEGPLPSTLKVRFDLAAPTASKSTLLSHGKHPGTATAPPLRVEHSAPLQRVEPNASPPRVEHSAPLQRVPTYADRTGNPARRRRQAKKNARTATRARVTTATPTTRSPITSKHRSKKAAPRNRATATPTATKAATARQQQKQQADKAASSAGRRAQRHSQPSTSQSPAPTASIPRHRHNTRSSSHFVATSHSAHLATASLTQPPPAVHSPTAVDFEQHNKLPPHAFWTAYSAVNPITGASLESTTFDPSEQDKEWLNAAYSAVRPPLLETANSAVHPDTGETVEYKQLRTSSAGPAWVDAAADEIGRLAQGNKPHMLQGTNTMHFIPISAIPDDRQATYLKIVAADKPNKAINKRIRFTVGGDRIDFKGDVSTKTADLTTAKCLFNSVISTPNA